MEAPEQRRMNEAARQKSVETVSGLGWRAARDGLRRAA